MRRLGLALCVMGGLVAAGASGGGEKKDRGPDGTWVVVGMEQDGKKLPDKAVKKLNMKLQLKGNNYQVTMGGKVIDKGTSTVDIKKTPNTLDIKADEGPNQGKTVLAIVAIDGDTMKACYNMEGKDRPTEFQAKEGSGHVLILYQRETKKKDE